MGKKEDHSSKESGVDSNPTSENTQVKIRRDSSGIRSAYANVFNVTGTREEIALLFGDSQSSHELRREVRLIDRIIMSPFTAKQFGLRLNDVIHNYESKYGVIDIRPSATTGEDQGLLRRVPFSKPRQSDEKKDQLLQLVQDLDVELGLERSFKLSKKTLLQNRFLLGTSKFSIKSNPHDAILHICERMAMPKNFLVTFSEKLSQANYVHFGFEENTTTCIYKAYLEFYDEIEKEVSVQPNSCGPFLLHLGFKWDVSDNAKQALTQYMWYPLLSVKDMLVRLSHIFDAHEHRNPLQITRGILTTVASRIDPNAILYLEVTEENNPRRSFDINMYRANIQLKELYPFLLQMFRHYTIPPEQFYTLYNTAKTKQLGHLSGGIDREGRDFLTLYYGVEGFSVHGNAPEDRLLMEASARTNGLPEQPLHQLALPPKEQTAEKASLLFQLVQSLNLQYGLERSFKISEKNLVENRFLLGFKREAIGRKANDRILAICEGIAMPSDFLNAFQENLPQANIVLFGFEENEKAAIFKAYLEFGARFKEALPQNRKTLDPFMIHMGFKWDVSDSANRTLARYMCYPSISFENMLERMSNIYEGHRYRDSFDISKGILSVASSRIDHPKCLYVEVNEENNPRRSFDINIYRARFEMSELYPLFLKMCRHYSISSHVFHHLYHQISTKIFGHLSGGIDRTGKDFLTVYYGLEPIES